MEAYRSGHNEAVLKTVWVQAHGGSNPSASAKIADVAQVVEHILGKDEVTSSSLVISSKIRESKYSRIFLYLRSNKKARLLRALHITHIID